MGKEDEKENAKDIRSCPHFKNIYILYFNRKYKVVAEMGEVNLDEFFCPNEACPGHGKRGRGDIVLKERYGKQNTALLRCKSCNKTFSD